MGGSEFKNARGAQHALSDFPRMPPSEYRSIRDNICEIMSRFFDVVICPPEAPEKADHGDIDILATAADFDAVQLGKDLGAVQTRQYSRVKFHFAIPYSLHLGFQTGNQRSQSMDCTSALLVNDLSEAQTQPNRAKVGDEGTPVSQDTGFVQVDLTLCASLEALKWRVFSDSYGDFWQMILMIVWPFGLSYNDESFIVKIQNLEEKGGSKKNVRLPLRNNPERASPHCCSLSFLHSSLTEKLVPPDPVTDSDQVLVFLGLRWLDFENGFQSEEERELFCNFTAVENLLIVQTVFQFVASTRLFGTLSYMTTPQSSKLRSNLVGRQLLARFRTWLLKHTSELASHNTTLTRAEVFEEAIEFFGKRPELNAPLSEHHNAEQAAAVRQKVLAMVTTEVLKQDMPKMMQRRKIRSVMREIISRSQKDLEAKSLCETNGLENRLWAEYEICEDQVKMIINETREGPDTELALG